MRRLMAIAFSCAMMIGVSAASSGAPARGGPAPGATFEDESEADGASQVAPACWRASECTAYCAGGIPLCVAKHCACAS